MKAGASSWVNVVELHRVSADEALQLVDQALGPAESWKSPLLSYRLSSDFQADWKVEVGQWLATARSFGFLEKVLKPILGEQKHRAAGAVDPNDKHHLKLHQHLAAALFCHYLTATGWTFVDWEPDTGGDVDVDLSLRAPDGTLVELQVKAPGEPKPRTSAGRRGDPVSPRLCEAMEKAANQLPRPARSVALIAVLPLWDYPTAGALLALVRQTFGSTVQTHQRVELHAESFGRFLAGGWKHVSGVVTLETTRGVERSSYGCTTLLNPTATMPARPSWFPRSCVAVLEGERIEWLGGIPERKHGLPAGTVVQRTT
jgi:hypothetical protein